MKTHKMILFDYGQTLVCEAKFDGIKGAEGAGLFPVWYIGAIDLPYKEHKEILTVRNWKELEEILETT